MPSKPSRNTLIHCAACGEDYSPTYRRCPFCGERNDPKRAPARDEAPPPARARGREEEELDDGYVFSGQDAFDDEPEEEYYAPRPKGGKRLAPKQGGGFDLPPVNWPRLITFLCSLVIIVAALVIVFTFIYPQLHATKEPKPDTSQSVPPTSQGPDIVPTPDVSQPSAPVNSVEPTSPPDPVAPVLSGIVLKNADGKAVTDITLHVGSSAQLTAEFTPADWSGQVTWSSTNPEWITVSNTGYVTNVNNSGTFHNVYITVEADGVSVQCIVRALAGDTPVHSTPPPSDSEPPASQQPGGNQTSGSVTVGRPGTIVNAEGGLRVRSGPGTSNEIVASLLNGNAIQVIAAAENGWYQISFSGSGGATMYGYILGEYISTN